MSIPSLRSGIRCYIAFVGAAEAYFWCVFVKLLYAVSGSVAGHRKPKLFPPELDVLLAWSTVFRLGWLVVRLDWAVSQRDLIARSARTLSNYFGYVKTGCLLFRESTQARFGP